MFAIAAVVLFVLSAILEFGALKGIDPAGLVYAGLACLAAHLLYPVVPWRRPPP